jgi:hypothetical protein
MSDEKFDAFLEWADSVVKTWPTWKQNLLGGTGTKNTPREPVENCLSDGWEKMQTRNFELEQQNRRLVNERKELRLELKAALEQRVELQKQVDELEEQLAFVKWNGNQHPNYMRAQVHNLINLIELDKINLDITVKGVNNNIIKGDKIPLILMKADPFESALGEKGKTPSQTPDYFYSGWFYVKGFNLSWTLGKNSNTIYYSTELT